MSPEADIVERLKFPPGLSSPDDHPVNVALRAEARAEITKLRTERDSARSAVQEIAYPILAMQKRLKPDEKLDGVVAVALANNAEYLRSIALKALSDTASTVIATEGKTHD